MCVTGKKVKEAGPRKVLEDRITGIEERLAKLEENQARILEVLRLGPAADVDDVSFDRAIQALLQGDKKPLANFFKRGGKIPKR